MAMASSVKADAGVHICLLYTSASYIAGCAGTACVQADRDYHVPATGTIDVYKRQV